MHFVNFYKTKMCGNTLFTRVHNIRSNEKSYAMLRPQKYENDYPPEYNEVHVTILLM